jgi:MSHA biogenesis protein MshQ
MNASRTTLREMLSRWRRGIARGLSPAIATFSLLLLATPIQAAPPTFQAFSAIAASADGNNDPTVTLPAHALNDILLLATIVRRNNQTVATPAGWTQIGTPTVRSTVATYQFFWKRAAGGSETNPVINRGQNGDVYAAVVTYRGAITTGDPWEVKGTVTTGTTDPSVITGITTLTDDSLVVVAVSGEDDNNASITTTGTNPAAYTAHYVESATGADGVITFSEFARTTAGPTGNVSVDWNTAVPIGFGGIVLALKPPVTTFNQSAYRLFDNADSTNVGAVLAAQDTAATLGSTGAAFRLRMLVHIAGVNLAISGQAFKLQFAASSGTCDTGFAGETYADVTAASVIAYNNNATPADGANLAANANDPTHGADTVVNQTYEELNNFTNPAAINIGQDGKWDFALVDNGAPSSTPYCFRVVKDTGVLLDTYTVIPEITTSRGTILYFHDAATPNLGTLPATTTLSSTTPNVTATGAGTNRDMDETIGTAQASAALTTLAQMGLQANWFRRFLSRPLAAQTLPTGVWTIQGGASEANAASNMLPWGAVIKVWRPSTGAVVATLLDNPALGIVANEPGTTETNRSSSTGSIAGVAVNDGDVLIIELWADNTQANATARTNTIFYDGTTEGSTTSNAAFLQAPGAITFYRSLRQSAYRLFNNADSTDVGTALAAQDTSGALGSAGAAFRLRMLLHVADINLGISGQAFKLQFVDKGTGTCAAPAGGTPAAYTDVTAATVIAYNNNATPADGAALTANAGDPTHGADTVVNQTYEELNNFTNSVAINRGQDGRWDFSVIDNGAPGSTTYCFRAVKSTGTLLDTYSVFPEITTAAVATAGGFNAYETSTAVGAITGVIKTKIAGSTISLDMIALNTAKNAIATTFTGTVRVEVLNASNNTGAPDANGCRPTWSVIQTLSPDPTFTDGRDAISFTQANSYPDVRLRITYPAGAPTVTGCSNDNFAIRPDSLASFAVTDNDWQTAGLGRTLDDATFILPPPGGAGKVHKAGRPLSVRATARNAAAATTGNYVGAPTATLSTCGSAACTATQGALTLTTTFVAGQLSSDTASYDNVGSFALQLVDSTFAVVDAADTTGDCTASGRYVCSATINVGRFVPDHFAVSLNAPVFGTACGPGAFTYVGQTFNYTTAPVITLTAQDFANNTTTLYNTIGNWFRITAASLTGKAYTAATGTLDTTGLPGTDPVILSSGAGVGTLSFSSGTGFFFTRTTPVAPFDGDISLAINVIDADGVAYASNPARFGTATAGNGVAFSSGKPMRFGRLAIRNANGSQLVPMAVPIETQYWNGTVFVTNTSDSCTSIANDNVAMSNFAGNLAACETAVSGGGTLSAGRRTLLLAAPGSANDGNVTLTANLGAATSGTTCTTVGGGTVPATGANRTYLQGNWTGASYDQNPSARETFGVYKGSDEVIFIRENF